MANLKNLQHAASEAAGKSASSNRRGPEPTPAGVADAAPPTRLNARAGKIAMTFHLSEDFKRGLRLVQGLRAHLTDVIDSHQSGTVLLFFVR